MKVLQFTIPVAHDKTIITEQVELPHFYPHLHRHKEAQLTWIQQGAGTLITGNNMHPFQSGDIYLLGANLPHLFKSSPEYFDVENTRGVLALTIFFNPDGQLSALLDLPEMQTVRSFVQRSEQGFKFDSTRTGNIIKLMQLIRDSTAPDNLIHFLQLMSDLSKSEDMLPLSTFGNAVRISESEGIRIGNIYSFILQHYNRPLALEEAAKIAYMTPHAFCRYFKKHTGHTFVSFLNEIRINEACKCLVANTYDSIAAVAYQCGFSSITNFNRVFRAVTNNTPKEYKEKYLGKVS
jgi:AraC-like DNA-binding protein